MNAYKRIINCSLILVLLSFPTSFAYSKTAPSSFADLAEKLMPSELSGGMKKRIGIARAIALQPSYIFYDEPTTGLDPVMTDAINRLINKFQKNDGVTSVIITHEMRTIKDVADRVLMLHDGRVIFDGDPEAMNSTDNLIVQQFITGDSTLVEEEK